MQEQIGFKIMAFEMKAAQYLSQSPEERVRGLSILLPIQDRGGFVFMIAYTKKESAETELFLQVLSDQLHRLAESFGKETNPQHRFEQFLGALNETLSGHVREGRWTFPIGWVHALVGIASHRQMFLSGTGELSALFLHKKPSQRYQLFNLFHGIQSEQSLPTWEKTFAVVLDGDLHPGDIFCVCDKDLQQMIAPDELNQILSSLPPVSSMEKIRQYFSHKETLLLIVLKISDEKMVKQTHASVETLARVESSTDQLLEDQRPHIAAMIMRVLSWIKDHKSAKSRILQELNAKDTTITTIKRLGRILWRVIKKLASSQERQNIRKKLRLSALVFHISRVPRSTKFLVLGIGLALAVLLIGITLLSQSQAATQKEQAYQDRLATIEDLMERAAGAVIYKDEDQARSLYINAQTLIETFPTDTPEHAAKAQALQADLETALDEIRHLITIPNPPLLGDLAQISDGVFGNNLIQTQDGLYIFGSNGTIYLFNREKKNFETKGSIEKQIVSKVVSQEDGRMYFLGSDGGIYAVSSKAETITSTNIHDPVWVDIQAYADRLYVLRPTTQTQEGQVVRFERNGNSFSQESNWITSRTSSLDEAVSLAIDGTVFVLMKNGKIIRFSSGSEEGWDVGVVDPTITFATKIWTNTESKYLYVLESETNRLVVFEKESGEFLVQYRSPAFTGLTDFVVDEKGYTIYLLAGSKLYSIAPSHLK